MAGGIADGQKNRFIIRLSFGEGLIGPGMPVYRIVSMLDEIGAFFIDEVVGGHDILLRVAIGNEVGLKSRICL